jgi:gamma-glutamyltranspeptidase
MEMALQKYGTKPRKEVIAPAIKLAEERFPAGAGRCRSAGVRHRRVQGHKDSGSIFLSNGEPMQVGQKLVQKDLGKTLKDYLRERHRRLLQRLGSRRHRHVEPGQQGHHRSGRPRQIQDP